MRQRLFLLYGAGLVLLALLMLAAGNGWTVGSATPWWVVGGGGNASSSTSYRLISTVEQAAPVGVSTNGTMKLEAGLWYATPDLDADGVPDITETRCGSDSLNSASKPERIDGAFAGADEDGDALVDEALPPGASIADCDGDGYKGTSEAHVFSASGGQDQDPCGNSAWPADLTGTDNQINILDITSFLAPTFLLFNPVGTFPGDVRWDLVLDNEINIVDLTNIITLAPPMLGGNPALFATCPWAP